MADHQVGVDSWSITSEEAWRAVPTTILIGRSDIFIQAEQHEYQFGVKLDRWSAVIANALTARGCEVRTVPQGMAVTPAPSA